MPKPSAASRDVLGELLETGKSQVSPKKFVKSVKKQITGKDEKGKIGKPASGNILKELLPKAPDEKALSEMKLKDAKSKEQSLSQARTGLEREKMARYQKIQQDILVEAKKAENQKEVKKRREEMDLEKSKEVEQKLKPVITPKSAKKMPGLDFLRRKQRKAEIKLGKIG